ncbi:hypothetical protein [Streptomyces tanashiensis]|uniref:ABM domain-containing protein n=1 Tax=Streptomyces tanashiensis TaxID=67367 RepID=A0ABY6QXX7_9ACTN|nr:hypothetical protein [Streptomyces tanashiensis]UZX22532.1 hypothetical protein LDH80_18105 [Streptomyces tanashiensis]GGY59488.1 hypothetical protein GCM10010299_77400 [Streptomyces tanashiensis]
MRKGVVVTIEIPGGTQEQYEETTRLIQGAEWFPPQGFIAHASGPDGSGGWRITDFFDSEENFLAFVEKARPMFEQSGMPPVMPNFQPAVNVITG